MKEYVENKKEYVKICRNMKEYVKNMKEYVKIRRNKSKDEEICRKNIRICGKYEGI